MVISRIYLIIISSALINSAESINLMARPVTYLVPKILYLYCSYENYIFYHVNSVISLRKSIFGREEKIKSDLYRESKEICYSVGAEKNE